MKSVKKKIALLAAIAAVLPIRIPSAEEMPRSLRSLTYSFVKDVEFNPEKMILTEKTTLKLFGLTVYQSAEPYQVCDD